MAKAKKKIVKSKRELGVYMTLKELTEIKGKYYTWGLKDGREEVAQGLRDLLEVEKASLDTY